MLAKIRTIPIWAAAMIVALVAFAYVTSNKPQQASAPQANWVMAWQTCKTATLQRLKAPDDAEFQDVTEVQHSQAGAADFNFTSYVTAPNSFGARLRTPIVCGVHWTGSRYTLTRLDLAN